MKRFIFILAVMFLALSVAVVAADKKEKGKTIQSGEIFYSVTHFLAGDPLTMGFDDYGYNYQGHMFKGSYYDSYAGGAGFSPYTG